MTSLPPKLARAAASTDHLLGEPHAHLRWMSSAPDALPIGTRACELAELVSRALGRLWHVGWRHTFLSRCQFAAAFQRQKIRVGRAALPELPWPLNTQCSPIASCPTE